MAKQAHDPGVMKRRKRDKEQRATQLDDRRNNPNSRAHTKRQKRDNK